MSTPEPSFSVNVDVTNPGQFFACCGLLELAHRLWPGAEGWFDGSRFCLVRPDQQPAVFEDLVRPVIECSVEALAGPDSKTAPIALGSPARMRLSWWLRPDGSTNLFKTWAANATSKQMFCKWQKPLARCLASLNGQADDLLTLSDRVQGSYGFDSDLGWDALGIGFSLNEHARLRELPTRPAVELFGAIGLQRFVPHLDEREQVVRYATWNVPLSAAVARAAALALVSAVTERRLRTRFVFRGSFKGLDSAVIQGDFDE